MLGTLTHSAIWHGNQLSRVASSSVPSGFAELDRELPGGGWPTAALTEILPQHAGIGELRILGTALAALSAQKRTLVWIAPPHMPYAPALAAIGIGLEHVVIVTTRSPRETLWATEQALRSKACGAVLAWPGAIKYPELRRLQLAAEDNPVLAVLFRQPQASAETSCAALRIDLQTYHGQLAVRILKRRGATLSAPILLHSHAVTPGRAIVEHFVTSSRSMPSPPAPLPQRGTGELRAKPLCRAVS